MRKSARTGFTLVELLVVMSIIAILAAMLMPAVNAVREQARRTQCTNNMRNVALALVQHDANKGTLPGYAQFRDEVNRTGAMSWVFPTLPYIERNDIFKAYGPQGTKSGSTPSEFIKILACPNDGTARSGTNISYVVNCGRRYDNDNLASAVFHRCTNNNRADDIRVSLSMISGGDGTSQTLMLSENVDAGTWVNASEEHVGFCYADSSNTQAYLMNKDLGKNSRPRASAYHPGGVVVSFCDPHVVFLSESIDPVVWQLIFTPNGQGAGQTTLLSEEQLGNL